MSSPSIVLVISFYKPLLNWLGCDILTSFLPALWSIGDCPSFYCSVLVDSPYFSASPSRSHPSVAKAFLSLALSAHHLTIKKHIIIDFQNKNIDFTTSFKVCYTNSTHQNFQQTQNGQQRSTNCNNFTTLHVEQRKNLMARFLGVREV